MRKKDWHLYNRKDFFFISWKESLLLDRKEVIVYKTEKG